MSLRITLAIFTKDLVDALRDTRIVVVLLTPILLGVLYNVTLPAELRAEVKLGYAPWSASAIPEALRDGLQRNLDITLVAFSDDEALRRAVRERTADLGLLFPADVETAVRSGATPEITALLPTGITPGGELILGRLDLLLRELAGQRPPALVRTEPVERPGAQPVLFAQLGIRTPLVLATVVMLVGMIALIVVPMLLTEESEKRTLDALLLAGSYLDVMVAKTLVGLLYIGLSIPILLVLTRLRPEDPVTFTVGAALLALALVGFGLLLGGAFRNANQVYTWSSFFLVPVIGPAFAAAIPDLPAGVQTALRAIPTSEAMRFFANGMAGKAIYSDLWASAAVIAAWGALAYALLGWRLARREG